MGQDDWTTLPDANGGTDTGLPTDCEEGYYAQLHPFLTHYLTVGGDACTGTGTTGSWNRFTGSSNGWQEVSVDLGAYAGEQVELSVSYVTDPGSGGIGVFVDDTELVVGGTPRDTEGFETALGPWSTPGAPGSTARRTRPTGPVPDRCSIRRPPSRPVTPCCSASAWNTWPVRPSGSS